MEIEICKVGSLETNCYVLKKNDSCLIVDPGNELEKIVKCIGSCKVVGVIITHYHFDHIGALEELVKLKNADVYDFHNFKEGKNIICDFVFDVLRVPGHKEDSICLYFVDEKLMFCGDFIFKDAVGRWDLPGGNFKELQSSIRKILLYSEDLVLYPGHGERTTLKNERKNLENYLKCF